MRKTALFSFFLPLPFTCLLFCQEPNKTAAYDGVFAYAINTRQLVTISKDVNESNARLLTKAICATHSISSAISLTHLKNKDDAGRTIFQYEADSEIPAGNYCLLVDSTAHQKLFTWGSGAPELLYEKKCLSEIAEQAESLTGRKIASCYFIGGYGTGRLELIEYASDSLGERLAALMVIDYSLMGEGSRYSIIRFPAASAIWTTEKDGKFHPERFRLLFTISDDPDSQVWLVAIEWAGPTRTDLTLYQSVGTELRPILVNHDSSHHDKQSSDMALK